MKIGLANLATLMAMYLLSDKEALLVSSARVLLAGFLFGSLASLADAMSGAVVSWLGMCLLKKARRLSVIGVSAGGGCLHNVAQLAVAALAVKGSGISAYLPVLIIAGTLTGCVNGVVAQIVLAKLPESADPTKKSLK